LARLSLANVNSYEVWAFRKARGLPHIRQHSRDEVEVRGSRI
jgi:hypothetical protein